MFQRHEILFIHLSVLGNILYRGGGKPKTFLTADDNHFEIGRFIILIGFILLCNCKCHQNEIAIHNFCIKINLTSSFLIASHKPLFHRLME